MADLVGSMPTPPSDVARLNPLGETESERTANALRVRQMARQILVEAPDDDDDEEDFDDDDDDVDEDEDDDDDDVEEEEDVVEVNKKQDEWWQRLKELQSQYGPALAARDKEAKERILDYDPKQGALTTPGSSTSMTSPHSTTTRSGVIRALLPCSASRPALICIMCG
jgi:hypothetical protein